MTAEDKKKVAVDSLRLAAQGHPPEMQGVLKAGGIHHNVYVQRGWDALLTAMEEAGKKPPKRPDPAQPEFMFSYGGKAQEVPAGQVINPDVLDDDDFSFDEPVKAAAKQHHAGNRTPQRSQCADRISWACHGRPQGRSTRSRCF